MSLLLHYRINEGMNVTENLEVGNEKSVDFVVREINSNSDKGINIEIELREDRKSEYFNLFEDDYYKILPHCDLYLPKNPFLRTKNSIESVLIELIAPRNVRFGDRKRYD